MRLGFLVFSSMMLGCGCSSGTSAGSGAAQSKPPPCATPAHEVTTLYSGNVSGLAAVGDNVIIQAEGLLSVDIGSQQATPIAMVQNPSDLVALRDTLYFTATEPDGPPNAQGKQGSTTVFQSVPASGGTPETIPSINPGNLAHAVDDDSIYFDGFGSSSGASTVLKLTPPSTKPVELELDGSILINAIAVHAGQVYIAGDDFKSSSQTQNGVIEIISKNGGKARRLVSDIGHPFNLVADDRGLYWIEDPPNFGQSHLVRSNLDGSSRTTLVEALDSALAVAYGRLCFVGDALESISTSGGKPTTLATDQTSPGMFLVVGGNLVWVDPASKALSDPTVPRVLTTCISD